MNVDPGEGEILWGLKLDSSLGLNEIRRKAGATYFMSRLALFACLIAAETNQRDLILGTYATDRTHVATQTMFGFFSNPVTLRLRFDPKATFHDWLIAVRDVSARAAAYSYIPFEEVLGQLRANRMPIPQLNMLFSVGRAPVVEHFAGLELQTLKHPPGRMPWRFTFECNEHYERDHCRVTFDANIYDPARVRAFIERYRHLAAVVSRHPDMALHRLLEESGIEGRRPPEI